MTLLYLLALVVVMVILIGCVEGMVCAVAAQMIRLAKRRWRARQLDNVVRLDDQRRRLHLAYHAGNRS